MYLQPNKMTRLLSALFVLLIAGALLEAQGRGHGKKPDPPPPPNGPILSLPWRLFGARNDRWYEKRLANGSVPTLFPAPLAGQWSYNNYLVTDRRAGTYEVGQYLHVTLRIDTTGSPVFHGNLEPGNTCPAPATARPYIEGYNGFGIIGTAPSDRRWWSNPSAIVLAGGTHTLTVPLQPQYWSNANGQFGDTLPAAFTATLANVGRMGVTFGGGCFFGHGVNVSGGTATLTITDYRVS